MDVTTRTSPPSEPPKTVRSDDAHDATRPADWPGPGPIDLRRHDLPHRSALTEWWYVHAHVGLAGAPGGNDEERQASVFAAFFRIVSGRDEVTREPTYAHFLTWGLADCRGRKYYHDTIVDKASPALGLDRLARAEAGEHVPGAKDPRLRRALREILERGQIPYPDHVFETEPFVHLRGRLELEFDDNRFEKLDDGSYRLSLWHRYHEVGVDLLMVPDKEPVRHGDDGVVQGPDGGDMFYYFVPRLAVSGSVTLDGRSVSVTSGGGWYDHEFGGGTRDGAGDAGLAAAGDAPATPGDTQGSERTAWSWCALQLDDGSELTAYHLVDLDDGANLGQRVVMIAPDGARSEAGDVVFEPLNAWCSTRTFNTYPTRWRLFSRAARLECELAADFDDQEVVTLISRPAFWEGRVRVSGTRGDHAITGCGFVERSGHLTVENLEDFFKAVGQEVRKSVANILPFEPSYEVVRDLVASEERDHYMEGVDIRQFVKTGVQPVRDITDRGGKGWRSYAALACCDVVGGDSRKYIHWLAMPELMHVGSLIVDDVQDRSTVRRGGPACHVVHGEALAINAGTSCYFMGQHLLQGTDVSNAQKLELYDMYFEALRAGHAGQAADIEGLWSYLPRAIETGDTSELELRVMAIYRLKTAAPASALARMGALVGGGTRAQIDGVGRYFESLGLAFQMVDDVLNLRGFADNLKNRGEDLHNGKVTLPVVKALAKLERDRRKWMCDTILSMPEERAVIDELLEVIEATGGLDETERAARALIEKAWWAVDPLLEPSIVKLMLRAFGWFVLERHY